MFDYDYGGYGPPDCSGWERELDGCEAQVRDLRLRNERLFAALVTLGLTSSEVRQIEAGKSHALPSMGTEKESDA